MTFGYLPKKALDLLHFLDHILGGQKNICFQFCFIDNYLTYATVKKMGLIWALQRCFDKKQKIPFKFNAIRLENNFGLTAFPA